MEHLHFYPDQEKIISFKPKVIFSGLLNGNSSWFNGIHMHNFCEIMYITGGEGIIKILNKEYTIKQGDIVVYNSGVFHEERCTGNELSMLFFAIDNFSIPGMNQGQIVPNGASPVIDSGSYDDVMKTFLSVMVTELQQKPTHYKAISTNIASMIVYYILRLYEVKTEKSAHIAICEKAKEFIDKNYEKPINLGNLASSFHISKYYFIHAFKETTGMSPMKYLLFVRINAAKDLLSKTEMAIGDIALAVGYDNGLAFSRAFKNSENISPTEYRNTIMRDKH